MTVDGENQMLEELATQQAALVLMAGLLHRAGHIDAANLASLLRQWGREASHIGDGHSAERLARKIEEAAFDVVPPPQRPDLKLV